MLLGDVLDSEDMDTEYKEFCFKNNVYDIFSKRDIHDFVMTNRWLPNLNEAIIENLHKYFSFYVPKYMSAFHNSRKALCKLYIGVNDYGEITGIPFKGNLRIYSEYFKIFIESILEQSVSDKCCVKIGLDIIENDIDRDVLNDDYTKKLLAKYKKFHKSYKENYASFVKNKQKWIKELYLYKGRLHDLINNNDIKLDFAKFLENKNLLHSFPELHMKTINIPSECVKHYKNNPNELIYWIIQYKDEKIKKLLASKPREPLVPKILNIKYCLFTQLSALRRRLVKNPKVRYYTVVVNVQSSETCKHKIAYKDARNDQYRTVCRQSNNSTSSPECVECCVD